MRSSIRKHHRRSIRLPRYDYRSPGAYFVTICVRGGECLLGEIVDGEMRPSQFGRIVAHYWQRIPRHFRHVELDEWVIMPNHLHGILVFGDVARAEGDACLAGHEGQEVVAADGDLPGSGSGSRACVAPTGGVTGGCGG